MGRGTDLGGFRDRLGSVRASHQAKKSYNKTPGVSFHAAFDFDAPRPQNTYQKLKVNQNPDFYKRRISKNDEIMV